MTALPPRTNGSTGIVDAVTNLQQKSNLGDLRDYLAALFGTDGTKATARTTLDVPEIAAAILKTLIDAKGDLIVGSAADTPARLVVGADGRVLTTDAAEATGVKWAVPSSGGTTIPAGTRMLFQQTAAPTGFTKVTDAAYNNKALRIVTGTVSSGGATDFSSVFGSAKNSGSHTLAIADIPAHTHGGATGTESADHSHSGSTGTESAGHTHNLSGALNIIGAIDLGGTSGGSAGGNDLTTGGESASHTHSFTTGGRSVAHTHSVSSEGGGGDHTHTLSLDLSYHDVIICTKD